MHDVHYSPPFFQDGAPPPTTLTVQQDGSTVISNAETLNFEGTITVTSSGTTATIQVVGTKVDLLANRPAAVDAPFLLFFSSDFGYWSYSDGSSWTALALTVGGDLSGTADNATVEKILNQDVELDFDFVDDGSNGTAFVYSPSQNKIFPTFLNLAHFYKGDWDSGTTYFEGNLVRSSPGIRYRSKTTNLNSDPATNPSDWLPMGESGIGLYDGTIADGNALIWDDDLQAFFVKPVSWGTIAGTLSDQTDLQTALDTKLDISAPLIGDVVGTVGANSIAKIQDETIDLSIAMFGNAPDLVTAYGRLDNHLWYYSLNNTFQVILDGWQGSAPYFRTYDSAHSYTIGDVLKYGGNHWYISLINSNVNNQPDISPSDWTEITSNLNNKLFLTEPNVSSPDGAVIAADGTVFRRNANLAVTDTEVSVGFNINSFPLKLNDQVGTHRSLTVNSDKKLLVDGVISGINRIRSVTSGSYTLGSVAGTDYIYLVAGNHAGTLPTASGNSNRYTIKNNHSATNTVTRAGSDTINGATSYTLQPGEAIDLISDGTATWSVI